MWINLSNNGSVLASDIICNLATSYSGISITNTVFTLDTLKPNTSKWAIYDITIDNSYSQGDIVKFDFDYSSHGLTAEKVFTQLIGHVDEDFETGDFSKFIWESSNANAWITNTDVVYEGTYSSRSDTINDNDTSSLYITMNVLADDSISFQRRIFSEANYDRFYFYIDDKAQGVWSGISPWVKEKFAIKQGMHTLKWSYIKDDYSFVSKDAAFLDQILFPPTDAWTNVENAEEDLNNIKLMPNPATNYSILNFELESNQSANISLYNIKGQEVRIIQSNYRLNGQNQQIKIDTQDLSSGIYFIRIQAGNKHWFKKLIVL